MGSLVDNPHQEEKAAGNQAVVDHLQNGPIEGNGPTIIDRLRSRSGEEGHRGSYAQHEIPHMADRRIGDKALQIPLGQTDQGPINHADDAQRGNDIGHILENVGEEGNENPDHTIAP